MTEADFTEQIVMTMELFLLGVSVLFTLMSAYVVALYFFLRRAGIALRVWAFAFLSFTIALLGVYSVGANRHNIGLRRGLEDLAAREGLSPLGTMAIEAQADLVNSVTIQSLWVIGLALYAALAYLTFLHRWPEEARG